MPDLSLNAFQKGLDSMCEVCVLVGIKSLLVSPATNFATASPGGKATLDYGRDRAKRESLSSPPDVKHSNEPSNGKSGITPERGDRRKRGHWWLFRARSRLELGLQQIYSLTKMLSSPCWGSLYPGTGTSCHINELGFPPSFDKGWCWAL